MTRRLVPAVGLAVSLAGAAGCNPCDGARVVLTSEGGVSRLDVCAEVARTDDELRAGLAGRDDLPAGAGLLFDFAVTDEVCITGEGMRFPIDVVFLGGPEVLSEEGTGTVVSLGALAEDDPTVLCVEAVHRVLEVPAGAAAAVAVGDAVAIDFPPEAD